MKLRILKDLLVETVTGWVDDDVPALGAALAYYTLFSIAPILVIAIAVAGLVFGRAAAEGRVLEQLSGLMGADGAAMVQRLIQSVSDRSTSGFAAVAGVLTMLLGSTTAFAVLQDTLNRIWRAPAVPRSGSVVRWIRARVLSFGMVLGFGSLLLASLVLSAVLSALGARWEQGSGVLFLLLRVFNFGVSLVAITLIFAMVYKFLPRVAVAWRDVWVGAAVTALLFVVGELLIGLYLGRTGIGSAFGAAGSVLALLAWLYYSAQVFLLGAEFTSVFARRHGSRAGAPGAAP